MFKHKAFVIYDYGTGYSAEEWKNMVVKSFINHDPTESIIPSSVYTYWEFTNTGRVLHIEADCNCPERKIAI